MTQLCDDVDKEFLKRPWDKCECGSTATMVMVTPALNNNQAQHGESGEGKFLTHISNVGDSRTLIISNNKVYTTFMA